MDFTHLNKPEIIYELKLRQLQFAESNTAPELREILTENVNLECLSQSPLDLSTDLTAIENCLNLIETLILSYPNRKNKLSPYLTHTKNRLSLLDIHTEHTPEILNKYKSFWSRLRQSETKYYSLEQPPSLSHSSFHSACSLFDNTQQPSTTKENTSPSQSTFFQSLTKTLEDLSRNRPLADLRKFNYDGKGCPRDFIQKVEEFAICRNINYSSLYNNIYDFLSAHALDWFRANKSQFNNWESFKVLFYKYFDITDYDYKVKKFIDSRKQKLNERIIIYFAEMQSLFFKLHNPYSDEEKIDILRRNLLPHFSQRILPSDLSSVNNLLESCKFYESCLELSRSDSIDYSNVLPAHSHNLRNASPTHFYNGAITTQVAAISTNNSTNNVFCPRCRVSTHSLSNCTSNLKVCYRCGEPNVIFTNCPKCNPKN